MEIPLLAGENTMTLSRFHDPPRSSGTSHNDCAGPPPAGIFFSLRPAKNPMKRLSGDQNGSAASSVRGIGCHWSAFIARSHNCRFPFTVAEMTRLRPSGEMANAWKVWARALGRADGSPEGLFHRRSLAEVQERQRR